MIHLNSNVVMDNCTIHAREKVEKAITKKGAKLIYLLPYSPDFYLKSFSSEIKNILAFIKTSDYQELGKAIKFALHEITSENI